MTMKNGVLDDDEASLSREPSLHPLNVERAPRLQALANGDALTALGHFLVRRGSKGFRAIAGAFRVRRAIADLSRLDDRTLRDIGVDRERIPAIAQALHDGNDRDVRNVRNDVTPQQEIDTAPCSPADHGDAANDAGPRPMAA